LRTKLEKAFIASFLFFQLVVSHAINNNLKMYEPKMAANSFPEKMQPEKWTSAQELPDFSWHRIPKREKITKLPQTIPNFHKIKQKTLK
jgi:hypothetical protein